MKHRCNCLFLSLVGFTLAVMFSAKGAPLPSDWQHEQSFEISQSGLVKLSLPLETLDGARPGLEDLRIYNDAGNEVPYVIEHPAPANKIIRAAKSFQTALDALNTVITIETGLTQPLDSITLETPANNFIKAVRIEGSSDGQRWQNIAQGRPIFRQANGASELQLEIPPGAWAWLRLTVDDQRSQPVPFTGARVRAASAESAPDETVPVNILDRQESPGETRLSLNLGAANLTLSELQIETDEPLFTRQVTLAVPQIAEDSIHEQTVGSGVIYRLTIDGQSASLNLSIPLEAQVRSRELLMLIHNQDSPPLSIKSVHAQRRPVYLVFLAKEAGTHHLLTGNARSPAPQYDLATLGVNLKTVAVAPIAFSSLTNNPNYHAPDVLADLKNNGPPMQVASWEFRKPIKIVRAGVQQLEPDLEVLSRAELNLGDLRLVRNGEQIPYIIEHTSIQRALIPNVTVTNSTASPALTRWSFTLPKPNLPVTRLSCVARTPLFQREMNLYELIFDERGASDKYSRKTDTWTQTPDRKNKEFSLTFDPPEQTGSFELETLNGDNPPIELENFQFFYQATRLLFKADAGDQLFLYYGDSRADQPHYDLSLVANELLAANKTAATLGNEEPLKKVAWHANGTSAKGGIVLWGILALVVVVLLIVISRLLPKSEA